MASSLPLKTMSVEEKLQAMELLWDDLCANADDLVSPPWHGELLGEREAAVVRDEDAFKDWEAAKADINRKIR